MSIQEKMPDLDTKLVTNSGLKFNNEIREQFIAALGHDIKIKEAGYIRCKVGKASVYLDVVIPTDGLPVLTVYDNNTEKSYHIFKLSQMDEAISLFSSMVNTAN